MDLHMHVKYMHLPVEGDDNSMC